MNEGNECSYKACGGAVAVYLLLNPWRKVLSPNQYACPSRAGQALCFAVIRHSICIQLPRSVFSSLLLNPLSRLDF